MIRQSITCDICGTEKRQTNHWFVAYTQAGELRVSNWSPNIRLRAGSKHLCGQTCLHKLVDEFMAGTLSGRVQASNAVPVEVELPIAASDASLTSSAAYARPDSRGKDSPPSSAPVRTISSLPAAVVAMAPAHAAAETRTLITAPPVEDAPNYASRQWRAEAWERERERSRHSSLSSRRKSS